MIELAVSINFHLNKRISVKRFKKILAATDSRYDEHPIVELAAEVAFINCSVLKIVDVVPAIPWAARISMKDHTHVHDLIMQEKLEKIDRLAEPIRSKGINVETEILTGGTSIELTREVLRNDHDLVMAVAKGRESVQKGFFGRTGRQLLGKCPAAVWLITRDTLAKFQLVLGCIDTSTNDPIDAELNEKIYELGMSISKYFNGQFSIMHAWSIWNEPLLKSRLMPGEFEQYISMNREQIETLLNKFLAKQDQQIDAKQVHLQNGEARYVIPHFVAENNVDVVVMGTVGRSGLSGMIMGNTAEHILDRLECSVLALKPASFVCPVRLDD